MKTNIIDISYYQGKVDFKKMKKKAEGVIMRCGYTGYGNSKSRVKDIRFEEYYKEAKEAGLLIGVYYYSCATSLSEAVEEAEFILSLVSDKEIDLGVWIDTEDDHDIKKYAPQSQFSIGKEKLTEVIDQVLCILKEYFVVGIYASTNWLNNQLDMNLLRDYPVWVAEYAFTCKYAGKYVMWQYTSKGNGSDYGVSSQYVDLNHLYIDPEELRFIKREENEMNDSYNKVTYNGLVVHVAKFGKQENREYQGVVVGLKGKTQRSIYMEDAELEKSGWKSGVHINGPLFYDYQKAWYAEGILKVNGKVYQDWDTEFDMLPAIGFKEDGTMIIDTQYLIKNRLHEFKSACTSCFGVLKNGVVYERPSKHTSQYDCISGRSMIGKNSLGQIIMASFSGVTGKSGLRGSQLPDLARYLGMTDCVCMDGGGSVYFSTDGSIKLNTTRAVVADIILYYREKQASNIPDNTEDSTDKGTSGMVICTADKKLNIREQPVSGKVMVTVGKNEFIEVLDFLDGLKSDGYQWAKVKWNGFEGYSQIDTAYTALKEKNELK